MTKHSFLRIIALVVFGICMSGTTNAIPTTSDVTLENISGNEITLISAAVSPKAKDAESMAVKQAFFALLNHGVEGLQGGQPMLTENNKAFNYTFYKDNKYLNYLVSSPLKLDESKIGSDRRVRVRVTINLNRLKTYIAGSGCTLSPAWQDSKAAPATASLNPTIVVIPGLPPGEDDSFQGLKTYMENNPAVRHAVNAVSSQFSSHGYKTRDFLTMLSNSKTDDLFQEGMQTDAATMVIQQLPGDIVVRVFVDVVQDGNKAQCAVTIDAVEAQTAGKLCSSTFSSGQYMTTDAILLTDNALKKMEKPFFNRLRDAFSDMVDKGREVNMEFLLGETVSDWNFDLETPATETGFKEALEEWLRDRSHKGRYDMSRSTDKFIAASVNIPLWDAERNRSYTLGDFNSELRNFMKRHLGDAYESRISAMGQKLIITIE